MVGIDPEGFRIMANRIFALALKARNTFMQMKAPSSLRFPSRDFSDILGPYGE